jgi:hypothetical protein
MIPAIFLCLDYNSVYGKAVRYHSNRGFDFILQLRGAAYSNITRYNWKPLIKDILWRYKNHFCNDTCKSSLHPGKFWIDSLAL